MKARDIMTPRPFAVLATDDVWKAAEIMKYEDVGGVPVVENPVHPHLVGIITDRDLTIRCVARRHSGHCSVGDHMTPMPLQTVLPEAPVDEIVAKMEAAQVRRIPVVDAGGELLGIVAEADLAVKLAPNQALPARRRVKASTPPVIAKL
ncbi:MAG: CBS domain-containing protein [Gemmatimonadota bacterium]